MRVVITSFMTLTLIVAAMAQDTIRYKPLIAQRTGDHIRVSHRSVVTGHKSKLALRNGPWLALDSLGEVLVKTEYKASRSGKLTRKHGVEVYYDPDTHDTLLVRRFNRGNMVSQKAYRPCILDMGFNIVQAFPDFEGLTVAEYTVAKNIEAQNVAMMALTSHDMARILNDTNYHLYEDRIGDPELLTPARFGTKHRYNYISNPEMEIHPNVRSSIISFTDQLPGWSVASESPDLFVNASSSLSGATFTGFRVFTLEKHVEYLQNELKRPLKKDTTYCFTAHVRLSPGSKYATNAFGFLLAENRSYINTDELLRIKPSKHLDEQLLNYKTRWMKVQCSYTAKGGEKYLVLGSFQNHKELNLVDVGGDTRESYYYLDDVSLVPVSDASECGCNFTRKENEVVKEDEPDKYNNLAEGTTIVLEDIHFENDRDELLPESFKTLYELLEIMHNNPTMKVEIGGHTSSSGGRQHNMELSKRRAEAVKRFLTLYGVSSSRITTAGYGPDRPIKDNGTEEGQRQNRRVEFTVLSR